MYIDTHLDTLWQSLDVKRDFTRSQSDCHVDLPKALKGELFIGFFTGFPTNDNSITEKMLRDWLDFVKTTKNRLFRVKTGSDIDHLEKMWKNNSLNKRKIGAVLHLEGAAGIDTALNRLYIYYDLGLRSMSLTWNEQNHFATGVKGDKSKGLTTTGRDLITAMEDLGIIVDVSHLNDRSFWDVIDVVSKPIIASHSNLRHYADHPRNLTDEMVTAIGDTGGSVGINFCKNFLSTTPTHQPNRGCARYMIKRVIDLIDINHVHIGSDFDGCTTPKDIANIAIMPDFFDEIQQFLEIDLQDLTLIKYKNMLNIISKVWN